MVRSPYFFSLPHYCRMGFDDDVGCLCWEYGGCAKDKRESILGGFRKKLMRIEAMDDRGQLLLEGCGILGTLIKVTPAMAATVMGEEATEEAMA